MTDQNHSNSPAEHARTENGGASAGQNHRNRHHRPHHKHHHKPRPAAEQAENAREAVAPKTTEQAPKKPAHESNAGEPRNDASRNDAQHKRHDRRKNHRNRGGEPAGNHKNGHGTARHTNERRPYDPYEKPSREEIELSELRAQIVLKSADGSVPTVYGTPVPEKAAVPAPAPTPALEPTELPIDEPTSVMDAASNEDATAPEEISAPTAEPEEERVEVVGIRFRSAGKMYYFDPNGITAKKGDNAIVETTRGPEFGDVCLGNTMVNASATVAPLRPLIRIATPADVAQNAENREKEKKALVICQEKIEKHGLEMKLIDVQYAFDGSKLLFYFAAEGRVDFRELVRDLASVFRTRIELRQIGIRDEAKMLGGIGACGRPLCCSTFLPDFAQVSIKMAKDQNLSLNSSKISGVCGRLMCCLRFESEVYAEEIRLTPSNDTLVKTEDGIGVVVGSTPLAGTVRVALKDAPDTPPKTYHRSAVTVLGREKQGADGKSANQSSKDAQND